MKDNKDNASVSERVVSGSLCMGSLRWFARLLGMATTIVLARFLLPEDFGVVAAAMLVVVFFDILIDLGTDNYLIRMSSPERADYDTAWTLRLIVISVAALLIVLLAGPIAAFFEEERLVDVLLILAVASFLRGFSNIGLTMYRRELQFGKIAMIGLGQRLAGSSVTVVLAIVLQSYWAMVFGELAFRLTELLLSYLAHPYRPKFTISRFASQWAFCKWIVARNIAKFLQGQGDQLVVAKFYGIEQIGFYAMALRFANIPTTHLITPMLPPIYSGLAKKIEDPAVFLRSSLQVIGATATVMLPAVTLFVVLGELLVLNILGPNWQAAVPLVAPLVMMIALSVLAEPANTILTLMGRVKLLAVLYWLSALSMVGLLLVLSQFLSLEALAQSRVLIAVALIYTYYIWVRSALNTTWRSLLGSVIRPVLACVAMAMVLEMILYTGLADWLKLCAAIALGGPSYLFVLFVIWRLSGAPDSGEAILMRNFATLFARVAKKLKKVP